MKTPVSCFCSRLERSSIVCNNTAATSCRGTSHVLLHSMCLCTVHCVHVCVRRVLYLLSLKISPDGRTGFPSTELATTNLSLSGSNYARAFQDAEKTNKRIRPRWSQAVIQHSPGCMYVNICWPHVVWLIHITNPTVHVSD